jgi:hypothetical protein
MAIGDVIEVRIIGSLLSQQVVATHHFRSTDGVTDLTAFLAELDTAVGYNPHATDYAANLSYSRMVGTYLIPYGPAPIERALGASWTGAGVGDALPPQIATIVTKRTGLIGRRRRGRSYIAGELETYNVLGALTAARQAARQAYWTAFLARYTAPAAAAHWELGVWSPTTAGPAPPFSVLAFQPCTSLFVQPNWGTQRRRRIGVGV